MYLVGRRYTHWVPKNWNPKGKTIGTFHLTIYFGASYSFIILYYIYDLVTSSRRFVRNTKIVRYLVYDRSKLFYTYYKAGLTLPVKHLSDDNWTAWNQYEPYWCINIAMAKIAVTVNTLNRAEVFLVHNLGVNLRSVTVWRCFACVVVTAVDCGPPENPFNGNAVFTSTSYNSVVSYECKYGYILSGEPTRRCGADGKWSGTTPKCQGKC